MSLPRTTPTDAHATFMSLSVEKRLAESTRCREKHCNTVPVVVTAASGAPSLPRRFKFLMHEDSPVQLLAQTVRVQLGDSLMGGASAALFLFVVCPDKSSSSVVAAGSCSVGTLYADYGHADGFLHVSFTVENTFGTII
jgi:hypothetical protein